MIVKGYRSQAELAEKAGVSQVSVSRVLTGRAVNARTMAAVAKALGQRLDRYLVDVDSTKGEDQETRPPLVA